MTACGGNLGERYVARRRECQARSRRLDRTRGLSRLCAMAALLFAALLPAPVFAQVPDFYCGTMDTVGDTLKANPSFTVTPPPPGASAPSDFPLYYQGGVFGFDSGGDGYRFDVRVAGENSEGFVIVATKDKALRWTLSPREGNRLHVVGHLFPDHDDADQGKRDANGYEIMIPDGVACVSPVWWGGKAADAAPAAPGASIDGKLRDALANAVLADPAEVARLRDRLDIRLADLNGDGKNEAIVFVDDPGYCGSAGCEYQVFTFAGDGPKRIGGFLGFGLTPGTTISGGWRTLTLDSHDGPKRLVYKAGKYR